MNTHKIIGLKVSFKGIAGFLGRRIVNIAFLMKALLNQQYNAM